MTSALHVVRSRTEPTNSFPSRVAPALVLIHGSATDSSTWSIQLASPLRDHFALWAYDRRGTGRSPAAPAEVLTIEQHAEDAAALARQAGQEAEGPGGRVWMAGSSFGAVVTLEVMRRYPDVLHGAVLIEPPLGPSDELHPPGRELAGELERIAAEQGGEAAAERFLRTVLGEPAFERIPRAFRARSMRMWPQIHADTVALARYRPRYAELGQVLVPALLLGGECSAPVFRATLEALARALPRARLELVPGAGHMLHAEAPRRFTELVLGLAGLAEPARSTAATE